MNFKARWACIIAGGRELTDPGYVSAAVELCKWSHQITEVIYGGARGIDSSAKLWAKNNGIPYTEFKAEWHKYGHHAGPIRNEAMAKVGNALIAIPGQGPGTPNMINAARRYKLTIFVYDYKKETGYYINEPI